MGNITAMLWAGLKRAAPLAMAILSLATMFLGLFTGTVAAEGATDAVNSIWDYFPMIISLMMLSIIIGVLGGLFASFKFRK